MGRKQGPGLLRIRGVPHTQTAALHQNPKEPGERLIILHDQHDIGSRGSLREIRRRKLGGRSEDNWHHVQGLRHPAKKL